MRRFWLWILVLLVATAAFVYKFPPSDQSGLLAVVPSGVLAPSPSGEPLGPNIIVITSGDQGWKDVGFHGSGIKTPNIDALAAGGARLEQFYAEPLGEATRAALTTGRYPFRYGLQAALPSGREIALPTGEWSLSQALKNAGYQTALIGDGKSVKEAGASTAQLGDEAVKLIDNHDPKAPLFLDLAFSAPQAPYQATDADLELYNAINDPTRRAYAAQVTAVDAQIGRVVEALGKKGMRDNTLIVFQSDSGGVSNPADNGDYRGGKGADYEGGTRVVAVANWAGHIKPGTVVNQMIHEVDLYPTLIGVAGANATRAKALDGVDVWGTITDGKPSPRTEIVYDLQPFRAAIRQGDWKLVWTTTLPQTVELYDLSKDPSEKNNVAAANPDKVAALQNRANELAAGMVPPAGGDVRKPVGE